MNQIPDNVLKAISKNEIVSVYISIENKIYKLKANEDFEAIPESKYGSVKLSKYYR